VGLTTQELEDMRRWENLPTLIPSGWPAPVVVGYSPCCDHRRMSPYLRRGNTVHCQDPIAHPVEAFARVPRERFLGSGPWEISPAEVSGSSTFVAILVSDTRFCLVAG